MQGSDHREAAFRHRPRSWRSAWRSSACATPPPASDPEAVADFKQTNDPLEPTNRFFYAVNDGLDTYVLRPVAVAYRHGAGRGARGRSTTCSTNIAAARSSSPTTCCRPSRAGPATRMMRFLINTTAGVGGLFDVATDLGYPAARHRFRRHAGAVGRGRRAVPVPAGARARATRATRPASASMSALDRFTWASFGGVRRAAHRKFGVGAVDTRERLLDPIDKVKKTALDPYATFRSLYRQNRAVRDRRDTQRQPGHRAGLVSAALTPSNREIDRPDADADPTPPARLHRHDRPAGSPPAPRRLRPGAAARPRPRPSSSSSATSWSRSSTGPAATRTRSAGCSR